MHAHAVSPRRDTSRRQDGRAAPALAAPAEGESPCSALSARPGLPSALRAPSPRSPSAFAPQPPARFRMGGALVGGAGPRAEGRGLPGRAGAAVDAGLGPAAFRVTPRTASRRSSRVSTGTRGSFGGPPLRRCPELGGRFPRCAPALVRSPPLPLPARGPAEDKRPPVSWARTL